MSIEKAIAKLRDRVNDSRNYQELVDVVEAAARIPDRPSAVHRLLTPNWPEMKAALDALARAVNGGG